MILWRVAKSLYLWPFGPVVWNTMLSQTLWGEHKQRAFDLIAYNVWRKNILLSFICIFFHLASRHFLLPCLPVGKEKAHPVWETPSQVCMASSFSFSQYPSSSVFSPSLKTWTEPSQTERREKDENAQKGQKRDSRCCHDKENFATFATEGGSHTSGTRKCIFLHRMSNLLFLVALDPGYREGKQSEHE